MTRPTFDAYWLAVAAVIATRATCDRLHVGAVIVVDNRLVATGYNGSEPGDPHCDDAGHLMVNSGCTRTRHAERNAIDYAWAYSRVNLAHATLYLTHSPCRACLDAVIACGIRRVVYASLYRDAAVVETGRRLGVEMVGPQ